ncbi:MAG TPA: 3-oxoacyl-[acyl-carrier-protein] synthase III C-terminal domain-containing protein [Polyangia bacterium]
MSDEVFITGLGKFFPGPPIPNDELEEYLGRIHGRPARAKARVLAQNGIATRHYALDKQQRTLFRNSEMAANAVRDLLGRAALDGGVDFIGAATTQGDLCVPGFASMVHGELGFPACEIASLGGVCASGAAALKTAFLQVRAGEKRNAIACASELPSRLFKASRYEAYVPPDATLPFDAEFLRWMLSDGAGAALLQPAPAARGVSLRVDWIDIRSYAHEHATCMYAGGVKRDDGTMGPGWLDYPSFDAAGHEGALFLRQDVRQLDALIRLGVDGFFRLVDEGRLTPPEIDHVVCHYSSQFFRTRIFELLAKAGAPLPPEKWFSNLTTRGNVGSASVFVLLEELVNGGHVRPGQQVFVMIPESGRFTVSYMKLTAVGDGAAPRPVAPAAAAPAGPPPLALKTTTPATERLVRQLARVWIDFETRLHNVPIVARLESGRFTRDDYKLLLLNLRQQVVEGARWIARAASQMDADRFPLRSLFITHAREEHRDFELLERNYESVGGTLADIRGAAKNVGSEALSAWMFHRASQENPFDLLGAMFIIEGLGAQLAARWGGLIKDQLGLADEQVSFLLYHGGNDDRHLDKLEQALAAGDLDDRMVDRIVKTAKVTARLYLLQLEELGNV